MTNTQNKSKVLGGEGGAISTAEQIADEILKDRENKINELKEAVNTARDNYDRLVSELKDSAIKNNDVTAYLKRKAEMVAAHDVLELREMAYNHFVNEPLIDPAEYKKICSAVLSEVSAAELKTKEQLRAYSEEMAKAAAELKGIIDRANTVLRIMQDTIYQGADRTKSRTGEPLILTTETKAFNNWDAYNWGMSAVNHYAYLDYIKGLSK